MPSCRRRLPPPPNPIDRAVLGWYNAGKQTNVCLRQKPLPGMKGNTMNRLCTSLCRLSSFSAAVLCCAWNAPVLRAAEASPLAPLQFLVGNWAGGGDTDAGRSRGVSSIKTDLGGHVLVRRDHTDLPAAKGQSAASMDVLMLIYPSSADGRLHATYTDSGGHVIQYVAVRVEPGRLVEFDSEASPSVPIFRLTYTATSSENLAVKFEMAPPGAASQFHSVAVGTLKRSGK